VHVCVHVLITHYGYRLYIYVYYSNHIYIYTHNIHIVRQPGIGDIYPNSGLSYQSKQTGPPWSDASCGGRLFASPPRSTLRWDWSIHEIWLVGQEHLQNPVGYLWISLVKKNMVSPYVNLFIPMNMNESPWWNAKFFTLPSLSRISDGNGCTEQFSERIDHWYSSLEWRDLWRDQAMHSWKKLMWCYGSGLGAGSGFGIYEVVI